MNTWDAVKLYGMLGLAFGCASPRNGAGMNAQNILYTDTMRVAHVRYTPDGDYINMELIKNGRATEKYTEIIAAPESETTFFGDTILINHTNTTNKAINISALRRTRQR
ncbi:MAG: hypothetical protein ACI4NZ_00520 [Candidatus Enterousia sp.]